MKSTIRLLAVCLFITAFAHGEDSILAGTSTGLYRVAKTGTSLVWNKNDVKKIVRAGNSWFVLTGAGIFTSANLSTFEERNGGLPVKVLKIPANGTKNFVREIQELKDLEVHPDNPLILVTATKDAVFITRDGGITWKNIGINSVTAGIKAVSVLDLPDQKGIPALTVLMSHPIFGVSWRQIDDPKSVWTDLNAGLAQVPSIKWPDEVADLSAVRKSGSLELFASQTFMPRIYRLDWTAKKFVKVWAGPAYADTVEGLSVTVNSIVFSSPDYIREIPVSPLSAAVVPLPGNSPMAYNVSLKTGADAPAEVLSDWKSALGAVPGNLLSAWIPAERSGGRGTLSLSELWLLSPNKRTSPYSATAALKKGNYIPVHQVTTAAGYKAHLKTLSDNRLNMLVVDMKDDYGTLRYDSKDPTVLAKGKAGKGIEVEPFVAEAKANGIYLVARIVVFKDRSLAAWGGARYAVWNGKEGKAWAGFEYITRKVEEPVKTAGDASGSSPLPTIGGGAPPIASIAAATATPAPPPPAKTETVRKYYDEFWVDPYCEDVWAYNVAIAKELISRGFDEIQFDYIRFPTDGDNLEEASYRWQEAGMDKESALMSFLSYARREISAPISIDIYGANGWYRTGARTGQDVELLSRYVDVICPMFYPSHFEQGFLAQNPAEERPYRIYYYGSYRNTVIARNHVVVRPWAQAFYLNVSYDRAWYNADYVQRQIFGTRDSINAGYTYWNNSGRYGDLRPDVDLSTPYPWQTPEAAFSKNGPVFGIR